MVSIREEKSQYNLNDQLVYDDQDKLDGMWSRVKDLNDEVIVLSRELDVIEQDINDADEGTESTRSLERRRKNVIYERRISWLMNWLNLH